MTNDVENPGSGLREVHKCGGVTPVNGLKPSHRLICLLFAYRIVSNRN